VLIAEEVGPEYGGGLCDRVSSPSWFSGDDGPASEDRWTA